MKQPYLIQRCTTRDIKRKDITGIDSYLSFDYMGSAEFEFGALHHSTKRIVASSDQYVVYPAILEKSKRLWLLCKPGDLSELKSYLPKLANEELRLKEPAHLKRVLEGNPSFRTNVWWDIDNDWLAALSQDTIENIVIAFKRLKEKWAARAL